MRIEIALNKPCSSFLLAPDQNDPNKLVLELERTKFDDDDFQTKIINNQFMRNVAFKDVDRNTQVVMNLQQSAGYFIYKAQLVRNEQKHALSRYTLVVTLLKKDIAPTLALPYVKGKTIVIDPGHGGSDSGAIGPDRIMEKTVTLAVSKDLYQILVNNGATVVMTRTTDKDVYAPNDSAAVELQARVDVAELTPHTDIFVCIHANSFTSPTAHGTETYYYGASRRSKLLAQLIQTNLVAANGLYDRGISTANFYVLKHTTMPSILTELAFISNPHEEELLNTPAMQQKMAIGIGKGINEYFQEIAGK